MRIEDKVVTSLGPIWIVPTEASHIHASNGSNALNGDRSLPHVHTPFTVRGVEICVSAHLYKWRDGKWRIGREESSAYEQRQSLYLSRLGNWNTEVSESARKKIADIVTAVVGEWVAQSSAKLQQAEVEHLEDEYERAQNDHLEAQKVERAAASILQQLRARLDVARRQASDALAKVGA
jgi:hypothetical protein